MNTLARSQKDKLNAAIIHSNELLARGIKNIFEQNDMFRLIFFKRNIGDFVELLGQEDKIDILFLDINLFLKEQSTFQELKEQLSAKIVILSEKQSYFAAHEATVAGAQGYLLEDMGTEALKEAIKRVMAGYNYFHPLVVNELLENQLFKTREKGMAPISHKADVDHPFTKREIETLKLIAGGKDNEEIGEILNISERTVRNHVASIFKKIHVNSRTQAIILSNRNGWIDI